MRLLHAAALTAAALLLASAASAQGLGDAAAKEKQKRKTSPKQAKVYTDDNIGRSMAPVSSADQPASTDAAAKAKTDKPAEGAAADKDKPAEDPREKAQAEWHQKLDQAHKEEAAYQEMVDKVQHALNDTSSLYGSGRTANMQLLEENQKKLAETKTKIEALEEEGRRNAYR
jgi:hypothetical protein